MDRHINFEVVKCVLIASPGFVKDQFFDFMIRQATKMENKLLLDNRGKFLLVHASSGFKHSLSGMFIIQFYVSQKSYFISISLNIWLFSEILADPTVTAKLADTKAAGEVRALEAFFQMLQTEPEKAFYGLKQVEKASEAQGIETLLIADSLFRSVLN